VPILAARWISVVRAAIAFSMSEKDFSGICVSMRSSSDVTFKRGIIRNVCLSVCNLQVTLRGTYFIYLEINPKFTPELNKSNKQVTRPFKLRKTL